MKPVLIWVGLVCFVPVVLAASRVRAQSCDFCTETGTIRGSLQIGNEKSGNEEFEELQVRATRVGEWGPAGETRVYNRSDFELVLETGDDKHGPLDYRLSIEAKIVPEGDLTYGRYRAGIEGVWSVGANQTIPAELRLSTVPTTVRVEVLGAKVMGLNIDSTANSESSGRSVASMADWEVKGEASSIVEYELGLLGAGEDIYLHGCSALIELEDGTQIDWVLEDRLLDGTQESVDVDWVIDPSTLGYLRGELSYSGAGMEQASHSATGYETGYLNLNAKFEEGRYEIGPVAPGEYYFDLRSELEDGNRVEYPIRSTILSGNNERDLRVEFGTVKVPLHIDGATKGLKSLSLATRTEVPGQFRELTTSREQGADELGLTSSDPVSTELSIVSSKAPSEMTGLQIYLETPSDAQNRAPTFTYLDVWLPDDERRYELGTASELTLSPQSIELAKLNFVLDVVEPAGAEDKILREPRFFANFHGSDHELEPRFLEARVRNWDESRQPKVPFLAVAGYTYLVSANATVDGSEIDMGQSVVKVRPGIETDSGVDVAVELDEVNEGERTHIQAVFEEILEPGRSNLNVHSFGPKAPVGYEVYASGAEESSPQYIDIHTSAVVAEGSNVEICVYYGQAQSSAPKSRGDQLKLGHFVPDAANSGDCPEHGQWLAPGWCDVRVPGTGLEAEEPEGYICGTLASEDLSLMAVLVPVETSLPEPSGVNCVFGDVSQEVNGEQVIVPPPPALATQYATGLKVGSFLASAAWAHSQATGLDLHHFQASIDYLFHHVFAPQLASDTISDASVCRIRGLMQGITEHLAEVEASVLEGCKEKGQIHGQVAAQAFCTLAQIGGGPMPRPPVSEVKTKCDEVFTEDCFSAFRENAASDCPEFTVNQHEKTYQEASLEACTFSTSTTLFRADFVR